MRPGLPALSSRWQPAQFVRLGAHDVEALADARCDRLQVWRAQFCEQAAVAGQDDTEDGARVEVGGSQQTHLGQDRVG